MALQIKVWYPRSTKNFSNSTPKKQRIHSRNGQKTGRDTSSRKTHKWTTDHVKMLHITCLREFRTTMRYHLQQLEWLTLTRQETTSIGEEVE